MPRLDGKTALVTGAATGIGRATAVLLALSGARVVLFGLGDAELQAVAAECGGQPVAVGEIGELRREITFLGDTLNTASRIGQHCRVAGKRARISGVLLACLVPPPGMRVEPLGAVALAGKAQPIELYSLELDAPIAD